MSKNNEKVKLFIEVIGRLKRTAVFNKDNDNNDLRPSEEMFLVKIDMLNKDNKVKVTDLVKILQFAPSTVSTILKALEDKKYIVREKSDDNKREVYVSITEIGYKRLSVVKESRINMLNDLIDYLGEDDSSKLLEILNKTIDFLKNKREKKEKQDE